MSAPRIPIVVGHTYLTARTPQRLTVLETSERSQTVTYRRAGAQRLEVAPRWLFETVIVADVTVTDE